MTGAEVIALRAELADRYGECLGDETSWVNSLAVSPLERVRPAVDEWKRLNDHAPTLGELRQMARRLREEASIRPMIDGIRDTLRSAR